MIMVYRKLILFCCALVMVGKMTIKYLHCIVKVTIWN